VLGFVAGQPFAIDATALWSKCNQQRLGAVIMVVPSTPIYVVRFFWCLTERPPG
jgi:hypothetical protein